MTLEEIKKLWPAEKRNNLIRRTFNLLRKNTGVKLKLQSSYWGQGHASELWLIITYKNDMTDKYGKKTFSSTMLTDADGWSGLDDLCGANKVPTVELKSILRMSYLFWRQEK